MLGFSSPVWKCRARDAWFGWNLRVGSRHRHDGRGQTHVGKGEIHAWDGTLRANEHVRFPSKPSVRRVRPAPPTRRTRLASRVRGRQAPCTAASSRGRGRRHRSLHRPSDTGESSARPAGSARNRHRGGRIGRTRHPSGACAQSFGPAAPAGPALRRSRVSRRGSRRPVRGGRRGHSALAGFLIRVSARLAAVRSHNASRASVRSVEYRLAPCRDARVKSASRACASSRVAP